MTKHVFKVGDKVRDSRDHSRTGVVEAVDIAEQGGNATWAELNGWSEVQYSIQWDDKPYPRWAESQYAEPLPSGKTKVYLAGPMRGIEEFNFPLFLAVGEYLEREWNFEVFNPAQHDIDRGFDFSGYDGTEDLSDTGFDLRQSLGDDLEFVAREADLVVVLDGWERSKGARAEVATALALGIPVVRYDDLEHTEDAWDKVPRITEVPPLRNARWEPQSNHVARNPAIDIPGYIVSGPPSGEDGEWQEGDVVDIWAGTLGPIQEGEVRSVSSTGAEKGTKIERFDLLPTQALAKIARHFGVGAAKYAPNNWRKGYEWSKSYAALQRHLHAFWGGEDYDEETGSPHLAAAGFHVLTLLTYMDEQPGFDDRWKGNDD
ncbi:purine trans deoxyribosylase [Stenotrophomonas virus Jojan60]|nr:purine trans deoxyribosylase [Stenotrophomonas virus Jojan60]